MTGAAAVQAHYAHFAKRETILAALAAAGKDRGPLSPDDLAPFDQLHTGGRTATAAVTALLAPGADALVLDVGCGIGGPARLLAAARGCRLVGVDLTPDFVATAVALTRRTAQTDRVRFCVGSATALPLPDAAFDAAWHIHMSMNVADKAAMYREIARTLKPGARFALYDPVRGPGAEPAYPVPWAETPATSFLLDADALLETATAAGLRLIARRDATADGLAWFAALERERAASSGPPAPQPDPRLVAMTQNHRRNLASGAVAILGALFERP